MELYNNSISKHTNPTQAFENPFEALSESLRPEGSYWDSTYEVVSVVTYLIGVPREGSISDYPQIKAFPRLELDKNARIVRNLCIVRTAIMKNFKKINDAMTREYRLLENLTEYIPARAMMQLKADGVHFIKKSSKWLSQHIIEINRLISDRINNCRDLFPDWVKWDYIRELFIMPDGQNDAGTKAAAELYYANKNYYPYRCYINWIPYDAGYILYDDYKFIKVLYSQHNDYFDLRQTSDAGSLTKNQIYDFVRSSQKLVAFIDCENSDPYKVCAAIRGLAPDELAKLSKIILFDDVHTTAAWSVLEKYIDIPVEYMMIDRIKAGKSLVDTMLVARVCRAHYVEGVDSILLISSDSDYWGLIDSLDGARFMVMIESAKCGPDLKAALERRKIFYCYLDDFYAAGADDLKTAVLQAEIDRQLRDCAADLGAFLDHAVTRTRASMSLTEKERFLEKTLRRLELNIEKDGRVSIGIRR